MTNAWPWWEKSKATVFPACNSWLNFRVRGQFEIKILIVRHINTTYFIWIKKYILEPAIAWKLVTCQRVTLMGRHLSPRFGQVILVSGYPVSIAVNWSHRWCPKCVHYQFSCAPKLARKYEIEHWFPVVRTDGRCTVTWLPNFLGWVDLLTHGAPLARARAPLLTHPRRPRGGQSGREKRRDKRFQAQAEKPLGTDSHRTISKRSRECWFLIGLKKCFVLLCPIGEQHLLSSFSEFVHDGYWLDHGLSASCTKEMHAVGNLSVWYKRYISKYW